VNPQKVEEALRTLALGLAELAEAIQQSGTDEREHATVASTPAITGAPAQTPSSADTAPSFEELAPEEVTMEAVLAATGGTEVTSRPAPEGGLTMCPKHRVLYMDKGKGKFCPRKSDDPAWSNARGFCRINPSNAAEYLRIRAAA